MDNNREDCIDILFINAKFGVDIYFACSVAGSKSQKNKYLKIRKM
ncbi:hypothetical protein [Clostridium paraputrificum]|nr:hypothetical protein [Clostridium paraputrificum]